MTSPVSAADQTIALSIIKALKPLNQVGNTPGRVAAALRFSEIETFVALSLNPSLKLPSQVYGHLTC